MLVLAVCVPTVGRAQGVVRGVLYDDATGAPIRGTVMLIDPQSDAAVAYMATDSIGAFTLQVREGVYRISAVRPGYTSVLSAPVPLQNGERLTIRVPISEKGDPQHRIGVTEHVRPTASASQARDASLPPGFAGRRAVGTGRQYDRDELTRRGYETLGEFLQSVPGLTVPNPAAMSSAQMSRNAYTSSAVFQGSLVPCHVGWFLDGQRVDLPGQSDPLTDGLGSLRIDMIEAVEVFRGISEMPAQFADPDLRCGAIAVWMRKG